MTSTEISTMTDSSMPRAGVDDKDIAHILGNMQALQRKIEVLEQYIQHQNIVPTNVTAEGGNSDVENVVADASGNVTVATPSGIWRDNQASSNNNGDNYYAIDGPARQTNEKFPADSYSMMVLNGPRGGAWPLKSRIFFGVGLYVAMFQIIGLILLTLGALLDDGGQNLGKGNRSGLVQAAQILSLSFYVVFPDASLHDFAKALRYYPRSEEARDGDPVGIMKFACILRGTQGLLAIVPMWLLIMTSNSVVTVILKFAAINVISKFDESAFAIARTGAMGPIYKAEVERIENTEVPPCMYRDIIHIRYWTGVSIINLSALVAMLIAWNFNPAR